MSEEKPEVVPVEETAKPVTSARVRRPDASVQPVATAEAETITVPADVFYVESAKPKVVVEAPFRVEDLRVLDKGGRVVCHVGQPHLEWATREALAQFIVDKLNA